MKRSWLAAAVIGALLSLFCAETPESPVFPNGENSLRTGSGPRDPILCHGNMRDLGTGISMFYGLHNRYPDSIGELSGVDPHLCELRCPSCSLEYIYQTDSFDNYTVTCPLPEDPGHGSLTNGQPGWPPDPPAWPSVCHGNMMTLSTACALFFGENGRYPEVLFELVHEGYIDDEPECPACGDTYLYSTDGVLTYTVACPLPVDPNHGSVTDGQCSWPPDTSGCTDGCRSNMMSLASGMSMFYGCFNRYPTKLSELGTSGVMENWDIPCPGCGSIYHYWSDDDGQTYLIQCPLPEDPGHGSILDGVVSWE